MVLCTTDKTYELKEAETSNSLLISGDVQLADELDSTTEDQVLQRTVSMYRQSFYIARTLRGKGEPRSIETTNDPLVDSLHRDAQKQSHGITIF